MDKFEIVDFYPAKEFNKKNKFFGTLHIYLIDLEIDIRGIQLFARGPVINTWLPGTSGWDEDKKEMIRFPVFAFTNPKRTQDLHKSLREQIRPFLKAWFKENEKVEDEEYQEYLKYLKKQVERSLNFVDLKENIAKE